MVKVVFKLPMFIQHVFSCDFKTCIPS